MELVSTNLILKNRNRKKVDNLSLNFSIYKYVIKLNNINHIKKIFYKLNNYTISGSPQVPWLKQDGDVGS